MSFVQELKRRNVFRVAVAYAVIGWLLLQLSDVLISLLDLPDWIGRAVIFMLVIGFPLTLIFAWAFELTPDGIKRDKAVNRAEPGPGVRGRTLDFVIIASLVLALGYFVWERQDLTTTTFTDRTIAVLPFVDRSGIAEQEWFADGLTEEIINSLTRTPDLQVTSSTSSFAFKNSSEDVRTISASLGVAHILEGSVRRTADALRVAVQLIRARDGLNLWSATFERTNDDVIAIQEEIAIEIANALQTAIDPEALAAMVSAGTHSVPAYEAYLMGLALRVNSITSGDNTLNLEADRAFARAVSIDPEFSAAHHQRALFWLSELYANHPSMSGGSGLAINEVEKRFYDAIDQAIEHEDDEIVRTRYRARRAWIDMNFRQALRLYNEYLENRPGDEEAIWDRFIVLRSLALRDQAIKLALEVPKSDLQLGRVKYQSILAILHVQDKDALVSHVNLFVDRFPDDIYLLYQAHKAFLWAMDVDAAQDILPRILSSNFPDTNKALTQLRQACAEKRISDARRFHAEVLEKSDRLVTVWLAYRIIGEEDKANGVLREYDDQGNFHRLAGLLQRGDFDPRGLPNFMARLAGQGIEDREIFEIPFRCNR